VRNVAALKMILAIIREDQAMLNREKMAAQQAESEEIDQEEMA